MHLDGFNPSLPARRTELRRSRQTYMQVQLQDLSIIDAAVLGCPSIYLMAIPSPPPAPLISQERGDVAKVFGVLFFVLKLKPILNKNILKWKN